MRSLDLAWERSKILRDWRRWAVKLRKAAEKVLSGNLSGTYIFGSAVKNRLVASSDIDVLIVARDLPKSLIKRSEVKEEIVRESGLPLIHPFEIHLVNEEEARIYFRHIGREFVKVEDLEGR